MKRHNFRNLKVYQRAIEFAVDIYKLSKSFPKEDEIAAMIVGFSKSLSGI